MGVSCRPGSPPGRSGHGEDARDARADHRQAPRGEVHVAQGKSIAQAAEQIGATEDTYYRWRREYGGMKVDEARTLRELEKENARLERLLAAASRSAAMGSTRAGPSPGPGAKHPEVARQARPVIGPQPAASWRGLGFGRSLAILSHGSSVNWDLGAGILVLHVAGDSTTSRARKNPLSNRILKPLLRPGQGRVKSWSPRRAGRPRRRGGQARRSPSRCPIGSGRRLPALRR